MIAQLGERQTEDLKVPGSIPGHGKGYQFYFFVLEKHVGFWKTEESAKSAGLLSFVAFLSNISRSQRRITVWTF